MNNNRTIFQLGLLAAVLLALSTSLSAQPSQKDMEKMLKSAPWLDKESQKELETIYGWGKIQAQIDDSLAAIEKLARDSIRMERAKDSLSQRQKWLQTQLKNMTIVDKRRNPQISLMYRQYDTMVLICNQGRYGDSIIERQQKALLQCHRAENVLNHRYDKGDVEKAQKMMADEKKYVPEVAKDIENRLNRYEALTDNLRDALTRANKIRPEVDPTRADSRKIAYTKDFFEELGKYIDPVLVSPQGYPYLYGILSKAITEKIKDPSTDIKELIDQL